MLRVVYIQKDGASLLVGAWLSEKPFTKEARKAAKL